MAGKISLAIVLVAGLGALLAAPAGAMDLQRLIAPTEACPNQTDPTAPVAAQEAAMRCMSNFARERMGMGGMADAGDLDSSARDKSDDILRCDSFSHYACGRRFTYWMERVGYIPARCWRAAENIAWGTGAHGSVRSVFRAWIHSPGHRRNILGRYSQIGVGLVLGNLGGRSGAHVWTEHFGSHCGRPQPPRITGLAGARAVS